MPVANSSGGGDPISTIRLRQRPLLFRLLGTRSLTRSAGARRSVAVARGILTRLVYLAIILLVVSFLVFSLMSLLPGDPAQTIAAQSGIKDPAVIAQLRHQMGLDKSFLARFVSWLGNVLHGNLGKSYQNHQLVSSAIAARAPVSLQLILTVEVLALVIAVPVALCVALYRDGILDRIVTAVTFTLQAIPNFIMALLLILLLAVTLGWLPALGYTPMAQGFLTSERSILIPALALALSLVPIYIRVLRRSLLDTIQEEFVLVARAVGMPRRVVLFRYALKPSLPALVTVVGINIGALIGGTVVLEVISGVPGIGSLMFDSIRTGDYLVAQGVILLAASTYVVANFAVDLLHLVLDPRVRK